MIFLKQLRLAALGIIGACAANPIAVAYGQSAMAIQENVAHSGNISLPGFNAPFKQAWVRNMAGLCAGGNYYPVNPSYPIIAGGRVFVTAVCTPNPDAYNGFLYAFNAKTGALLWSNPINTDREPSSAKASIAFDRDTLYIMPYKGPLQALTPATGAVLWSTTLPSAWYDGYITAYNGQIFVPGVEPYAVYAVSETTEKLQWTTYTQSDWSSPAIGDNGLYLSGFCSTVKLALATGKPIWESISGGGGGGSIPVYYDQYTYVRDISGCGNRRIDANTGKRLTSYFAWPPPAFFTSGGVDYMLDLSDVDGTLHCRSLATDADVWTTNGNRQFDTAPIVVGDLIFEGSLTGEIFALSTTTGAVMWSANVGAQIGGYLDSPSVFSGGLGAGDGVLIVPSNNQLSAFVPG